MIDSKVEIAETVAPLSSLIECIVNHVIPGSSSAIRHHPQLLISATCDILANP
jgi:hypothetical protein